MSKLSQRLSKLQSDFSHAWTQLSLDTRLDELGRLEAEVAVPEIWNRPDEARKKNTRLARLHDELDPWLLLKTQLADISELLELDDASLEDELSAQLDAMAQSYQALRLSLRFTGKYDQNDAILRITAGTGGTEAMDWASMLERMYLRWAERHGASVQILDRVVGEEAGIKTVVLELTGANLYGQLKSEHGTHRLVRLSPFNADHLRQTSFALVEVLPVISDDDSDFQIDPKDLRVDVYRSGGHGGQGVNTTDSAVRITHLPTNIVVAIQNERSQIQNKAKAMEILRGKLQQLMQEQNAESLDKLRAGESASWGQQIRNYVLHPYKLVKDTRTKYETTDTDAVLDGNLDAIIAAYLDTLPSESAHAKT
ncbi:peptide chain release factor 2 [Candidatus Saccharibacteria bacterium]|nr:peptide chain release factor 2 [Candidatus Saccharibacteria bacterium]